MNLNSSRTRAWRRAQGDRYATKRLKQISHSRQQQGIYHHRLDDYPYPEAGRLTKAKVTSVRYGCLPAYRPSKQWRLLCCRSDKLLRAKQLKMHYPRKFWELELVDMP